MLGCIHPMSSPMMKRMFGLLCACADACCGAPAAAMDAANRPSQSFLLMFIDASADVVGTPNKKDRRRTSEFLIFVCMRNSERTLSVKTTAPHWTLVQCSGDGLLGYSQSRFRFGS